MTLKPSLNMIGITVWPQWPREVQTIQKCLIYTKEIHLCLKKLPFLAGALLCLVAMTSVASSTL